MRQMFCIITALVLLSVAGLGIRSTLQPPVALILVPGATEIQVFQPSMGEQVVTYRAPGSADAWREIVTRSLKMHGWIRPRWWLPYMGPDSYFRKSPLWFGTILDAAELEGEPNIVRITMRRRIEFPLWLHRLYGGYYEQLPMIAIEGSASAEGASCVVPGLAVNPARGERPSRDVSMKGGADAYSTPGAASYGYGHI